MATKHLKLTFGRYKATTITKLASLSIKKVKPVAKDWLLDLLDREAGELYELQERLQIERSILLRRLRVEEVEITKYRQKMHRIRLGLEMFLAENSHLLASRRKLLSKISKRNEHRYVSATNLLQTLVRENFGPNVNPIFLRSIFADTLQVSGAQDSDLQVASWALSYPGGIRLAVRSLEIELGNRIRARDEDDALRLLVNLLLAKLGKPAISKNKWFNFRVSLLGKSREMPAWARSAAKNLGFASEPTIYWGASFISGGKVGLAFALVYDLLPGTVPPDDSLPTYFPEPPRGGGFGTRTPNMGRG